MEIDRIGPERWRQRSVRGRRLTRAPLSRRAEHAANEQEDKTRQRRALRTHGYP